MNKKCAAVLSPLAVGPGQSAHLFHRRSWGVWGWRDWQRREMRWGGVPCWGTIIRSLLVTIPRHKAAISHTPINRQPNDFREQQWKKVIVKEIYTWNRTMMGVRGQLCIEVWQGKMHHKRTLQHFNRPSPHCLSIKTQKRGQREKRELVFWPSNSIPAIMVSHCYLDTFIVHLH